VLYNRRVHPRILIVALLFFASLAFQSTFITLDAFVSDEGIVMVAADDVARGRLLYVDCDVPLTPAVYLLQGIAFKLFGSTFLVSRALISIVNASCVVLVALLASCYLPFRFAALAGFIAIPVQIWMWPHAQFFSYNSLAILLCLVAMRLAWSIESGPARLRAAFFFGAALAAALWTKPNLPVATGAGVLLYWLSGWLRSSLNLPCRRRRGFSDLLREGVATLVGIAITSVPMIVYLASVGILDDMWQRLVAITGIYGDSPAGLFPPLLPLTSQIQSVRLSPDLMLPGMLVNGVNGLAADHGYQLLLAFSGWIDLFIRLLYYLPVVLFVAVGGLLLVRLWRRTWVEDDEAALLAWLTAVLLYLTIVSFPAFHYITPTLFPLIGLATFLAHRACTSSRDLPRRVGRVLSVTGFAAYWGLSLVALTIYLSIPRAPVETMRGTLWVDRATSVLWNDILEYTKSQVAEGDRVFVVPYFPLFYFLSGQDHPTRQVALGPTFPGMQAEDEIILELERERVEFVLQAKGVEYPGLEGFESSYPRLHHYLAERFRVDAVFEGEDWIYAEYLRRDEDMARAGR